MAASEGASSVAVVADDTDVWDLCRTTIWSRFLTEVSWT